MKESVEARLVEKERLILEQRERHARLVSRKHSVEAELHSLNEATREFVEQLQAMGRARVEMGDLRRTSPLSPVWGLDRGLPLDRYYIHAFLDRHRTDIRGTVLEIKDAGYTRAFGDDRVDRSDVLDIDPSNPQATIVADLSRADVIQSEAYDCFILTQTLGVVFDVAGALRHAVRILKPGGVLLCTLPAAGRISYEEGLTGDYWRFTEGSVRRLFTDAMPGGAVDVKGYGNVLACSAFLYGLAPEELTPSELDTVDPYFPLVYSVRAVKPSRPSILALPSSSGRQAGARSPARTTSGAVLTYHRVADEEEDRHRLSVPVDEFRAHMQSLRDDGYRVAPLRELVDAATAGLLDRRTVSLTFDDGYLDALTTVAPILQEFGFPGTFFIIGAALEGHHEFWWDALGRAFLSGRPLPERCVLRLASGVLDLPTRNREERQAAHDRIAEEFYRFGLGSRTSALGAIEAWAGSRSSPNDVRRPMSAEEVVQLAAAPGVSIGAHSQHHLRLPVLSRDEKQAEIASCKLRLENLLGRPVKAFSYPYGSCDIETMQLIREAGFDTAVTTEEGLVSMHTDRLRVPRIEVRCSGARAVADRLEDIWR